MLRRKMSIQIFKANRPKGTFIEPPLKIVASSFTAFPPSPSDILPHPLMGHDLISCPEKMHLRCATEVWSAWSWKTLIFASKSLHLLAAAASLAMGHLQGSGAEMVCIKRRYSGGWRG
eukprot:9484264-Pyramimonas_sp.AAC.1